MVEGAVTRLGRAQSLSLGSWQFVDLVLAVPHELPKGFDLTLALLASLGHLRP